MPKTARKRPSKTILFLAFCIATISALVVAEIAVRVLLNPTPPLGDIGYADAAGQPVTGAQEAMARGLIVDVPAKKPRPRTMFKPDQSFYITYQDNDVLQRDWFDEQGRVVNRINQFGLRERTEITPDKPNGQRRIVCLGDSFTFAWGIPVEQGWVRLLEDDLRKDGANIRTVNCGAAGTVCVDEYWYGLEYRFHKFQPDAVIMTLCLNDLIPSSGLNLLIPIEPTGSRLLDLAKGAIRGGPLNLDPARDWVQELLDLPEAEGKAGGLYNHDRPFAAMWSQGVPQQSMRATKAWCDQRDIPFMVIIWPFLQGLGKDRYYPFQKIHDLVQADCEQADIPLLDVLAQLKDTDQEDLWVTPADPHPNPLANQLVLPAITEFVRANTSW